VSFEESYLGQLRKQIGPQLVLIPGVLVVAQDTAGRVLLGLRGDTNTWGLPAGHAEVDSSFRKTAVTELWEETGLVTREEDLVAFASISEPEFQHYTYPNGHEVHSFALCFVTRHWTGEPHADGDEMVEVEFFDRHERPHVTGPSGLAIDLFERYVDTGEFQAR
jgi:8-oxo-dGTP pyrophosphatase MutT (NUDIX family)